MALLLKRKHFLSGTTHVALNSQTEVEGFMYCNSLYEFNILVHVHS